MKYQRKEIIGDCVLYLGDNIDILPHLDNIGAVVIDPPYGIGEAAGKNKSRSNMATSKDYGNFSWDDEPANQETINLCRQISKYQIIFGGNYFTLPPTSCWLVWDKQNGSNDFADCELAWTNLQKAVRRIYWRWHGMIRRGDDVREHPTQKPEGVMKWCIEHLPPYDGYLLDCYLGSGTTGVACAKMGRKFIGIEREPSYFEIACKRIEQAYAQPDLFVEQPKTKVENLKLDL